MRPDESTGGGGAKTKRFKGGFRARLAGMILDSRADGGRRQGWRPCVASIGLRPEIRPETLQTSLNPSAGDAGGDRRGWSNWWRGERKESARDFLGGDAIGEKPRRRKKGRKGGEGRGGEEMRGEERGGEHCRSESRSPPGISHGRGHDGILFPTVPRVPRKSRIHTG
jgi:hypothetical protein